MSNQERPDEIAPLAYDGNEFGDAIRAACRRAAEAVEPPEYHILAMPEMQAIRRLIKAVGESTWDAEPQLDLAWDDLPMFLVYWAEGAS